jgi:hypothetical protein
MGGQPGKPKPPGNPPEPREPQRTPPVEEPPSPIPVPPVERPPPSAFYAGISGGSRLSLGSRGPRGVARGPSLRHRVPQGRETDRQHG